MKKIFTIATLACISIMSMAASKKEKVYYLQDETRICIVFDFKNAKINRLHYEAWNDTEGMKVINRWTKSVIAFFNQMQDLTAPIDCINTGEKYDLLIKITEVDPDGETDGTIFLKEHGTEEVLTSAEIGVGDKDGKFEEAWYKTCENFAKKIASFTSKFKNKK